MQNDYPLPLQSVLHDRFNFQAPGFGSDPNKKLRIPTLLRQMQEAALTSTQRLGVSAFDLAPHALGWVLLGQNMRLFRRPEMGETFEVVTCPVGFERVFTYRDFHVLDTNGQHLAVSSTTWMLMNLHKRRMATLPDWIRKMHHEVPPTDQHLPKAKYKLIPFDEVLYTKTFRVDYHHLDSNGHLTNAVYSEWMLEGLPYDFLLHSTLTDLEIQFKQEAHYGDILRVNIGKGHAGYYQHGLFKENTLLASMQTQWMSEVST